MHCVWIIDVFGLVIVISHESPKLRDERYLLNCEMSMWLANFIKNGKKNFRQPMGMKLQWNFFKKE